MSQEYDSKPAAPKLEAASLAKLVGKNDETVESIRELIRATPMDSYRVQVLREFEGREIRFAHLPRSGLEHQPRVRKSRSDSGFAAPNGYPYRRDMWHMMSLTASEVSSRPSRHRSRFICFWAGRGKPAGHFLGEAYLLVQTSR